MKWISVSYEILGVFWAKMYFCQKKHLSSEPKNRCFSVIPAWTVSVVILGHFLDGPDGSTKLHWKWSKIKGTYAELTQAQKGQKHGLALKMTHSTETEIESCS